MNRLSRRALSGFLALLGTLLLAGCAAAPDGPAELDTKHEQCAFCRMGVSDRRFAAQVTAPGAQPRFFDDAGCLRDWLKKPTEEAPWTAWVSDHRTKTFVTAATAVFGKSPTVQTPMSSGILAWADAASRDADPASAGATPLDRSEVIGYLLEAKSP